MNTEIDEVVTVSNLRSAAGSRSYSRGEAYFQERAVHHLYCDGTQLTADVHGSQIYRVRITNNKGVLDGECSCPVGRDGYFCKHLVALGLAYLDSKKNGSGGKSQSDFSWKDFLQKCDKAELIKIILEMSPNNSDVIERYRMANLPSKSNDKLCELKSKVDELFELAEELEEYYDDYWDGYEEDDNEIEFRDQSELLVNVLELLAEHEEFELIWGTTTYAIGKFWDCSNAEMDSVQEFVDNLAECFLKAVHANVRSNDEVFRLFKEWEGHGDEFGYGIITSMLKGFPAEIKEKWKAEAMEKWREYPACKFGEHSRDEERDYVEDNLLAWANEHNDDRLKLEIMEKKLCYPKDAIELAKEYRRQGMQEKIVPLLKQAHNIFGRDTEIINLLTEELQNSGNNDEALKLAWMDFKKEPMSKHTLERLQTVSCKMNCWGEYYKKALDYLEEQDKKGSKGSFGYYYGTIREYRVEVLFSHADKKAAWELAQGSNLSEKCWLKLAEWRATEAPGEAAAVVKRLLAEALKPTGENAYRRVIELLLIYQKYLQKANREAEFIAYCNSIRIEYKRRRLLMEQMRAAKL